MVYQQFINYPSFTVYQNIASPLRRAGLPRDEIDRKVREAAATLRIEDLLERLPSELSGGQQQRTALARALVKDCGLLLLDEPLVNLDYKLREGLRAELQTIFGRGRSTVVYATTEPLEALAMGGNSIVLDAGRVLQTGRTVDVYHNPLDLRVGQVFSDPPMNTIDTRVEAGASRLGDILTVPLGGGLRRSGRVLPQPGPRLLDAHGHQRAGLSEAGAVVVAEHRRGGGRRGDGQHGDGQPGPRAGPGAATPGALGRAGRLRPQAE